MDAKMFFYQSATRAGMPITAVGDGDWNKSTPCSEWDLKALVRHMVYELVWIPDLLEGKTVAEIGDKYEGDIVGSDPVSAWKTAVQDANRAIEATSISTVVHLSMGDASVEDYINEVAADLLIHGWDVATSFI